MTDGHITRCPHCDTSFRVTEAQLEAARGAVRCGACLLVFSAVEHLVQPKSETELEPVWPDDEPNGELRDNEIETIVDRDDFSELSPVMMPFGSLMPRDAGDLSGDLSSGGAENAAPDQREQEASADPDDPLLHANPMPNDDDDEDRELAATTPPPSLTEFPSSDEVDGDDAADPDGQLDQLEDDDPGVADDTDLAGNEGTFADDDVPPHDVVLDIDTEEVDINESSPAGRPAWRWWGAAVLLAALLGAQFLWFERERLSLDPRYRDAYLGVCRFLPCSLPEFAEPEALGISSLIIRSHPTRAGALRADALLKNDAQWRQSFPELRLQFSSLQNKPIAARIFRPDEYLAGEMAGLQFIPAQTEVRVTLEIMDPGPDAVNYSLEML